MTRPRVLVAGIGNIFLGDDAFGVEVVRRLLGRPLPEGVRVADFGIRGLDLAHALTDDCDAAILVDATQRGGPPGTLYVLEPHTCLAEGRDLMDSVLATHGMHPARVLELIQAQGSPCPLLRIVGCEPATLGSEEEPAMGLSPPVGAAVNEAVRMVEELVREILADFR